MNLFLIIFTLVLGIYTCDAGCGTHHEGPYARTFQNFHGKTTARYTAKCEIECKNNGICVDTNTCQCPPNYQGQYCEFEKKPCLVFPPLPMNLYRKCSPDFCTITCAEGYKFIDGTSVTDIRCVNGKWQPASVGLTSIPDCQPECNPPCLNGGVCLSVNTCQCPAGYGGAQCQYAKCEIECKNNGICVDTNTCQCPPNYQGQYCEFEKKPCLVFPPLPMNSYRKCSPDFCTITCAEGYKFIDGTSVMDMRCVNGKWQPTSAGLTSIPDCQPECNPPCLNGGVCLSVNTCQCPAGYGGAQCQYAKCENECKNNGICVDTNTCQCPPNYQGQYCEFEKNSCHLFPPLPMNSRRKCTLDYCTITCTEGYKFTDGTSVMGMRCVNGKWQPTRAGLTSIPDCQPECNPPCLNGGICLSVNNCQCPAGFGGPQCQYGNS